MLANISLYHVLPTQHSLKKVILYPSFLTTTFYYNIFIGDGDVTIDSTMVEPKQLCELGGEEIIFPLSVVCQKKGKR